MKDALRTMFGFGEPQQSWDQAIMWGGAFLFVCYYLMRLAA